MSYKCCRGSLWRILIIFYHTGLCKFWPCLDWHHLFTPESNHFPTTYPPCTPRLLWTPGCPSASAGAWEWGHSHGICACRQWGQWRWRRWGGHLPQQCWWQRCCWGGCQRWCGLHLERTRCHLHGPKMKHILWRFEWIQYFIVGKISRLVPCTITWATIRSRSIYRSISIN